MKAEELGYPPQVILAGRFINDSMPKHATELAIKGLNEVGKVIKGSKVLIMGLTYKEDVPDTRESPVEEIVRELREFKVDVYGYDLLLSDEAIQRFGAKSLPRLDVKVDAVIIAVAHAQFRAMPVEKIRGLMKDHPVLIDVRGMVSGRSVDRAGIYYRKL